MIIKSFDINDTAQNRQVRALLADTFPHCYADEPESGEVVAYCTREGCISLVALDSKGDVLGFIGAQPNYGTTGWELHPLAVTANCQSKGVGRALVAELERRVVMAGAVMLYLGTDDEFDKTSLYGKDLYEGDLFENIRAIRNINRHPYEFYEKCGYKIVGVMPDANGHGRPDIYMAKTLVRPG